ncbi:MAG: Ig-like domain-containing protein, partial [Geobacter sp.]|nr:Ig-like domain-containing protein [Geobacter sp.]
MAIETEGEKGKSVIKGLDQGQHIERALVAPDGTITIPHGEPKLKAVDIADVDLLLSFSDESYVIIPNGALDAISEAPPQVFFTDNSDSLLPPPKSSNDSKITLADLFKLVGISNHAKAGSLRVVSGNVDASKTQEEVEAPKSHDNEQVTSKNVVLIDKAASPAPMVKVSSVIASTGKGPGLGAIVSTDEPVVADDPVVPLVTPRPSVYRPGQKVAPTTDPTIALDHNITADDIINSAEAGSNVAITGTVGGNALPGDTVTLTVNGNPFTGLIADDMTFSIDVSGADLAADSDKTIVAGITTNTTAIDTEGYRVDTQVAAPGVALASDTGTSGSDSITKTGTITLTGIEAGATLEYSTDGGTTWGSSVTEVEGSNTVLVRQTDVAGNTSDPGSLTFSLDTTPPPAPNVVLANDTGSSNNDKITNVGTLSVSGVESGANVEYSIDGGSHWSSGFAAAEGNNTVLVRQTDTAGNVSGSTTFRFVLDTQVATPGVQLANDTGVNGDHITSDATLTISAPAETVTREYSTDGGGSWSSGFAPVEGNNNVTVRDTDMAGNTVTTNHFFTLDTTPPTVTGQSFSYIENQTAGTVVATVAATDSTGITGFRFSDSANTTSLDGYYTVADNGQISITADGVAAGVAQNHFDVTPNSFTYGVEARDAAGNWSAAQDINLNVIADSISADITRPVVTAGQSFSYTENQTAGAVVATVAATDARGITGFHFSATGTSTSADGFYTIADNGQISITPAGVAAGAHNDFETAPNSFIYGIETRDAAGNWSVVENITLNVTDVDEIAPAAPGVALTNDSGSSNSDHITNVGTLSLSSIEAGATVEYSTDSGAHWSSSFTAVEGANSVQVRQTDVAGNVSGSSTLSFTLDTAAPVAPTVALNSITSDNILNIAEAGGNVAVTGTVSGEFQAGDTVTLTAGGGTYSGLANADGSFSISVAGSDLAGGGSVTASVVTHDAAGNISPASALVTQNYTSDQVAPATPTLTLDSITADNVINIAEAGGRVAVTGTVVGEFQPGDTITLTAGGHTYTGSPAADGSFSISVAGSDLAGGGSVTASVVTHDAAGNISPASALVMQNYTSDQ